MPALYTHYVFGQDVLNNLDKNIQKDIKDNITYYNMFNQGFDNLYYYHYKWNFYKTLGIKAHKKKIDIFFENTFKFIKENSLENDSTITNFIYGIINHYTLDTLLHPYINYQVSNLNIPHSKIEFMLDRNIWNNEKNSFFKVLIPKLKFNSNLINLINYVFKNTHNIDNIGKAFNRSHNNGYYIYRYFINDKLGIKTYLYKIVDFITPFKDIKLHENTFYMKKFDERLLNKEKLSWHHPNNKDEIYNYSLEELYNISLKISLKLNNLAYEILHNKKDTKELISLIKLINLKNISQFPLQ